MTALVLGRGIEGLATALALRSAGLDVRLGGAGVDEPDEVVELTANAVRVLNALGLRDAVDAAGPAHDARELRAVGSGHRTGHGRRGPLAHDRHGVAARLVPRRTLYAILLDAAREAGLVGSPETADVEGEPAALRIVADGSASAERAAHFPDTDAQDAGLARLDGIIRTGERDDRFVRDWAGGGALITFSPEPEGRAVRVLLESRAEDADAASAALDRLLADAHADLVRALDGFEIRGFSRPMHMSALPAWHRGEVLLVGEAAHPVLPHLDQGLALALEDAWILGRVLEDHDPDSDAPDAPLVRFHELRRRRASQVQRLAARQRADAAGLVAASPFGGFTRRLRSGVGAHLLPDLAMAGDDWLHGFDVHDPLEP